MKGQAGYSSSKKSGKGNSVGKGREVVDGSGVSMGMIYHAILQSPLCSSLGSQPTHFTYEKTEAQTDEAISPRACG